MISENIEDIEKLWHEQHEYNINAMNSIEKLDAASYFESAVDEDPNHPCIQSIYPDNSEHIYTYNEIDQLANQCANWLIENNVQKGDVIALMCNNCEEFIWIWLGIAKVGGIISCINTKLEDELLEHALLEAGDVKMSIISNELKVINKFKTLKNYNICGNIYILPINLYNDDVIHFDNGINIKTLIFNSSNERPDYNIRSNLDPNDSLFYIYTSGTTGRSKAAKFNHRRFIGAGVTWAYHMNLTKNDRFYNVLPLYHGNGGVVAVSACFRSRCTMVLRYKFSASNFFNDIRNYQCTSCIYIGELWRYVLTQPPNDNDKNHTLRVIAGNGLRSTTWVNIIERFGIEKIVEHYGQTEMPAAHPMINSYGKVGSCGFIPNSVRGTLGTEKLIQYNFETDSPIKDENGFCLESILDENNNMEGEAIVKLNGHYSGYTNDIETEKVIYRNVFEENDMWYHSGDILRVDQDGFFYFVDRAGDSFRWKGENVSTNEVSRVLGQFPGIIEANVYGVKVPHHDGKCGMASVLIHGIDLNNNDDDDDDDKNNDNNEKEEDLENFVFFISGISNYLLEKLPSYAIPRFIRIRKQENSKTTTLKFQKFQYVQEGFNPNVVTDDLYFNYGDHLAPLDNDLYDQIQSGTIKL